MPIERAVFHDPSWYVYWTAPGSAPPPPASSPVANFTATQQGTSLTVNFDGTGSYENGGSIASWAWSFGDGTAVSTLSSGVTSHTYAAAGTYSIALTVTDALGAKTVVTQSRTFSTTASIVPVASFTSTQQSSTRTVAFDASSSYETGGSIATYAWDFGDGATSTLASSTTTHAYAAVGTYSVKLTVTDGAGAQGSTTRSQAVVAAVLPVASFTASQERPTGTVDFDGSASSETNGTIVKWNWDFGDGSPVVNDTDGITQHSYAKAGTYSITLTVTDALGVQAQVTNSLQITFSAIPVATFTKSISGFSVAVDGSGSTSMNGSIASYAWNFGDGATSTGATTSHTYSSGGQYSITLVVKDNLGSTASSTQTVTFSSVPIALFKSTVSGKVASVDASSTIAPNPISSYTWSWNDTLSATYYEYGSSTSPITRAVSLKPTGSGNVMQSVVQSEVSQDFYMSQEVDKSVSPTTTMITRLDSTGKEIDHAKFVGAGHGTSIGLEDNGGKVYMWISWEQAASGGKSNDIVRFPWPGAGDWTRAAPPPGMKVVYPGGLAGGNRSDVQFDTKFDRVVIRITGSSTSNTWWLANRTDFLAGKVTKLNTITMSVGNLPAPAPAGSTATMQGFATLNETFFVLWGTAWTQNSATPTSSNGPTAVSTLEPPRIKQYRWSDGALINSYDPSGFDKPYANSHYEPEGLSVHVSPAGFPHFLFGWITGTTNSYNYNIYQIPTVTKTSTYPAPDTTGKTSSHTYAANGTYQVGLTVKDTTGLTDTETHAVYIGTAPPANKPPVASFKYAIAADAAKTWNRVDFDASASTDSDGTIVQYNWDFQQSQFTSTTPLASGYLFNAAGTYAVKLTVTDDAGAMNTTTTWINIVAPTPTGNQPPVANFTYTAGTGTNWAAYSFDGSTSTDSDGTIVSYTWDFGDIVTPPPPSNAPPTAAFTATPSSTTTSVTFSAAGSTDSDGTIANYAWDFGDGATGSGVSVTHPYASGGAYTVRLTVTDNVGATGTISKSVTATTPAPPPPASTTPAWSHIIYVWMENHSTTQIIGSSSAPYINSLANSGVFFSKAQAVAHPSEPNYLAAFSGSTQGVTDDSDYNLGNLPNMYSQVVAKGLTMKGYVEAPVMRKHAPWESFSNAAACEADFSTFPTNYANLPRVCWVIPNQNDDMHDGTVTQGDTWLKNHIDPVVQWAKANNSLVILTWDEDDDGAANGNDIPLILAGANLIPGTYTTVVDHYDMLALIEDSLGLTRLGNAVGRAVLTAPFSGGTPVTNQPPVSSFTATMSAATVSVNGSQSSDPDGSIASYAWNFGDGATGTGSTASHIYSASGTYTITLTVTDDKGSTGSSTKSVTATVATANKPPVASFVTTQTDLKVNVDASASTDSDGTIVKYDWDFQQSTYSTTSPIANGYVYNAAGTYTIKLTVTDNSGVTGTTSKSITVTAPVTTPPASGAPGDAGGSGTQPTGSGIVLLQNLAGADLTAKFNAGGTNKVSLPSATQQFSNFTGTTNSSVGIRLTSNLAGILGSGSKYSTIQMTPSSSDKASTVPAQGSGSTNQLQYLYVNAPAQNFVIDGVMILATEQGHLYNGFEIQGARNFTMSNCSVFHVPGNAGSPPGETFAINLYAQEDTTATVNFTNVTVDGQGVGAAGLGTNRTRGIINITNTVTKNMGYSAGIALWEVAATSTINIRNNVMSGNHRNLGLEAHGGVVNVYDPVWGDYASGGHDVNLTWGIASGYTWVNGTLNFYFTSATNWQNFIANRTNKKIAIITNPKQDYGSGVVAAPYNDLWNSCNVYIGGVKQTASDYITFSGTRI